jgi:glycosyltransferase involved in cell wall biosynthesis
VKVLVVSHLYPSPGRAGALFVHDQVVALRGLGVDIRVVSPTIYTPRPLRINDRLRARGATPAAAVIDGVAIEYPRVVVPPRRLLAWRQGDLFYRGLRPLLPALRAADLDLIHAHQAFPDGAAVRLLAEDLGVAYAITVHGADVNVNLGRPGRLRERTRRALDGAAAVMAVSSAVARRLEGFVSTERLHTVPNGVTGHGQVAPSALLPGRPLVLSVGNLYASKGHAVVLAALARLGAQGRDIAWVVVGDGPEEGRLKARARELDITGQVTFLGWRPHDEVLALMARADAFVLPSAPEGFGLVYAEAMAQGTPVIACRGEGPDDFVEDGVSGLLVPPHDAGAVARAIALLLDDRATAARLVRAGHAAVAALTWQRNAERQLEIYERLPAGRPAASGTRRP